MARLEASFRTGKPAELTALARIVISSFSAGAIARPKCRRGRGHPEFGAKDCRPQAHSLHVCCTFVAASPVRSILFLL